MFGVFSAMIIESIVGNARSSMFYGLMCAFLLVQALSKHLRPSGARLSGAGSDVPKAGAEGAGSALDLQAQTQADIQNKNS